MSQKVNQHRTLIGSNQKSKVSLENQKDNLRNYNSVQQPQKYQQKPLFVYNESSNAKPMMKYDSQNYNQQLGFNLQSEKQYQTTNQGQNQQKLPSLDKMQQYNRQKRGTDILIKENNEYEKQLYKQQLNNIIQNSKQINIQHTQSNFNRNKSTNIQKKAQSVPIKKNIENLKKESFEELENEYDREQLQYQNKNIQESAKFNIKNPTFNVISNKNMKPTLEYNKNVKSQPELQQNLISNKQQETPLQKINNAQTNSTKIISQKQPIKDIQDLKLNDNFYYGTYKDQQGYTKQYQITSLVKTRAGQYTPHEKKINQDSSINIIKQVDDNQIGFFGVLDGHGEYGDQVSNYVKENLQKVLFNYLKQNQSITHILTQTFQTVSNDLLNNSKIETYLSGSTAVTVLIQGNKIYCSNCGDSRAVLCRFSTREQKWKSIGLSNDHKPEIAQEKRRIEQSGGRVELQIDENGQNEGIYRVWNKNLTYPGLAMSRSFGDKAGREVGVISDPEILKHEIGEEDKFIIIASDGIWEFINNEEACKIVSPFYKNNNINGAAEALVKQAVKLWQENDDTIDDITCVLLFINNTEEQKIKKKQ